jgi:16S rRNA (guanine966-N2)-methyltransferase
VRPTADRVKESLFNVIGPRVADADFLDLFAGSGAVGIEALSRGARSCTFVEIATDHLQVVKENLVETGLAAGAELMRRDARSAVVDLGRRRAQFDLIFCDPPYGQELVPASLSGMVEHHLLRPSGWVICEHHKKDLMPNQVAAPQAAGGLVKFRELVFGETVLSLYQRDSEPQGRQSE